MFRFEALLGLDVLLLLLLFTMLDLMSELSGIPGEVEVLVSKKLAEKLIEFRPFPPSKIGSECIGLRLCDIFVQVNFLSHRQFKTSIFEKKSKN